MKKGNKGVLCFLLSMLVLWGCSVTAFADGRVTYDGNAKDFIFSPGSKYSPTDLFADFKDVMPGDTLHKRLQLTTRLNIM